jgi:hypothetical protein
VPSVFSPGESLGSSFPKKKKKKKKKRKKEKKKNSFLLTLNRERPKKTNFCRGSVGISITGVCVIWNEFLCTYVRSSHKSLCIAPYFMIERASDEPVITPKKPSTSSERTRQASPRQETIYIATKNKYMKQIRTS